MGGKIFNPAGPLKWELFCEGQCQETVNKVHVDSDGLCFFACVHSFPPPPKKTLKQNIQFILSSLILYNVYNPVIKRPQWVFLQLTNQTIIDRALALSVNFVDHVLQLISFNGTCCMICGGESFNRKISRVAGGGSVILDIDPVINQSPNMTLLFFLQTNLLHDIKHYHSRLH